MRMSAFYLPLGTALTLACLDGVEAQGQGLAGRVSGAPDGPISFTYRARPDACGDGMGTIRISSLSFSMLQTTNGTGVACGEGPVRVTLTKAGGEIVALKTFVGPVPEPLEGSSLGQVSGPEAAGYLLRLAQTLEGRPGRDAILPAALADSAAIVDPLLDLVRNQALSRQVRTSAATWAGREADRGGSGGERVVDVLIGIARDQTEALWMRSQAMSVLGRMTQGSGISRLLSLRNSDDAWLAAAALKALADTDDPRGREALREIAANRNLTEEIRVEAIKGLGRRYMTGPDARFLRELYPGLTSRSAKEAVVDVTGAVGGSENTDWLLRVARDGNEEPRVRSRAVRSASRAGARSRDIGLLYDSANERQVEEAVVAELIRIGDETAIDRLIEIAKREDDTRSRRRLISRLGRSDHPKLKAFLRGLVEN